MPPRNETSDEIPDQSKPKTKNQIEDERLLVLLKAYRRKLCGLEQATQEREVLMKALYLLIDGMAGFDRYAQSSDNRNKRGRLGMARGLGLEGEELANLMQERLENNAKRDGQYLYGWDENKGRSIRTYIWKMGENVAQGMGREAVMDGIRFRRAIGTKRNASLDANVKSEEECIREEADREIREYADAKRRGVTTQLGESPGVAIKSVSISAFEGEDSRGISVNKKTKFPDNLKVSIDSDLTSALRVRPLLANLKTVGEEMNGKSVVIDGKKKDLTADHRQIWNAFLALDEEHLEMLDDSIQKLAVRFGWSPSKAKRHLAAGFIFFQNHRLFDQCCDLFISHRMSRNMDDAQMGVAKRKAKEFLLGKVPVRSADQEMRENAQDLFRKIIHQWIEKYGSN